MRYFALQTTATPLQQEFFTQLLNSRPFINERGGHLSRMTLRELDAMAEGFYPPGDLITGRATQGALGVPTDYAYSRTLQALYGGFWRHSSLPPEVRDIRAEAQQDTLSALPWLKNLSALAARPILRIELHIDWQQTRRQFIPQIEQLFEEWGVLHELERAKLASNWRRVENWVSTDSPNSNSGITVASVRTFNNPYLFRYSRAIRTLSLSR